MQLIAKSLCIKVRRNLDFLISLDFTVEKLHQIKKMKFIVLSAVLLALLHGLSAQVDSRESQKIQREFNATLRAAETRAGKIANDIRYRIQAPLSQFFKRYEAVRNRIGEKLNALGPDGQAIATMISNDVKSLAVRLISEFSDSELQPKIGQVLINMKSEYLEKIQNDVTLLKIAVDSDPRLIKCWNENKKNLNKLINGALQRGHIIVVDVSTHLNRNISSWSNQVFNGVRQIERDVESKCGADTECLNEYVRIEIETTKSKQIHFSFYFYFSTRTITKQSRCKLSRWQRKRRKLFMMH